MVIEEIEITRRMGSLANKLMGEFGFSENKRNELIKNLIETSKFSRWFKDHDLHLQGEMLNLSTAKKKLRGFTKSAKEFRDCLKDIAQTITCAEGSSSSEIAKSTSESSTNDFVRRVIEVAYNLDEDKEKKHTDDENCLEDIQEKLDRTIILVEDLLKRLRGKGAGPRRKSLFLEEIIQRLIYSYKIISEKDSLPVPRYSAANNRYEGDLYYFINDCVNEIIPDFGKESFELGSIIGKVIRSPNRLTSNGIDIISPEFYGFRQFGSP